MDKGKKPLPVMINGMAGAGRDLRDQLCALATPFNLTTTCSFDANRLHLVGFRIMHVHDDVETSGTVPRRFPSLVSLCQRGLCYLHFDLNYL